jgi:hypothetical protein
VAVNFVQNDSVYIHGKRLMVTENNRIIRAYNNVRFYKTDMSGNVTHCPGSKTITKLIGNPVLWNGKAKLQEI